MFRHVNDFNVNYKYNICISCYTLISTTCMIGSLPDFQIELSQDETEMSRVLVTPDSDSLLITYD